MHGRMGERRHVRPFPTYGRTGAARSRREARWVAKSIVIATVGRDLVTSVALRLVDFRGPKTPCDQSVTAEFSITSDARL
jgi:hypothetical protein